MLASRSRWQQIFAVILLALGLAVVMPSAPAQAYQNFTNSLVADKGLAEVGTSRPTGWDQPGECIKSAQRWVNAAGGYFGGGGVISGYVNSGATEVGLGGAIKGDVIQYTRNSGNYNTDNNDWTHVHTVVVVANLGNNRFDIVQSNVPAGSGLVSRNTNWTPTPASGWVARVWRFGQPAPVTPSYDDVLRIKKKVASDGAHLVYSATRARVYETWWRPGGDGLHTSQIIHIAQNNIVDVDKIEQSNGTHNLYTAVPDGIWETWWRPGEELHHNKIISGLNGVRRVSVLNKVESGSTTHLLYVLAADGPYEFWWRDGGDGIHSSRLAHLIDPVDFVRATAADGAEQLLTATAGAVWETRWSPGGSVTTRNVIGISQNDIKGVDKYVGPDGTETLFTAVGSGVWMTTWQGAGGAPSHQHLVGNLPGTTGVKARLDGGTRQIYLMTSTKVQEYWMSATGGGGSTLVNANDIHDIAIGRDGGFYLLYHTDNANVGETWWGDGGIHYGEIASFD